MKRSIDQVREADTSTMSAYELQRLEHIKRNHEMLVRLGLVDDVIKKDVEEKKEAQRKARAARKRASKAIGPKAPGRCRSAQPAHKLVPYPAHQSRYVEATASSARK